MLKRACCVYVLAQLQGCAHSLSLSHTHALRKKIGRIFTLLRLVSHDWLSLVADLLSSPNSVL